MYVLTNKSNFPQVMTIDKTIHQHHLILSHIPVCIPTGFLCRSCNG